MKNFLKLLMILSLFATAACSSNSNKEGAEGDKVVEEDADFLVDSDKEDLVAEDEKFDEFVEEEPLIQEGEVAQVADSELVEDRNAAAEPIEEVVDTPPAAAAPARPVAMSGEYGQYTVARGDTLMLIAFKIYGDYTRWRSIAALNPGYETIIPVGTVLKYQRPAQEFVWSPQGLPHLIRRGETLGIISEDKYGTPARWKDIWHNNEPMIKNPNLIFAGFTIYYIPKEDRDVASEY